MGEMRDSDWSRQNLLRSDWLLPRVATYTTDVNAKPGQSLCFHTSELPLCIIRIMNGPRPRPRPRLRPLVLYIQTKIRKKMNDGMNS